MKSPKDWVILVTIGALLFPVARAAAQSTCDDVAGRDHLNVMTINLLFSEIPDRQLRLTRIADFAKTRADAGEPIDLMLLQEVVSGSLVATASSAFDLQQLLSLRGLNYNRRESLATGIPWLLAVGNAILSRCAIVVTLSRFLPVVTEEPFPGLNFAVPLTRGVIMSRIQVPGFGRVNVYNTHLCANCDPVTERLTQATALLNFIATVESFFFGNTPIILGGDFNTNLNFPDNHFVHNAITGGQGFLDSYRQAQNNMCFSCCNPLDSQEGIAGCTYAVGSNPYANNPPFATGPLSRIDYVFLKSNRFAVNTCVVVFPPGNFVSDHSGVLATIALQ